MRKLRTVRLAGAAAALALLLASCAENAPQDSLRPAGPYQEEIHRLFVPVFWVAAAIFFLVQGALVYFLYRYRHRPGREGVPPQVHGNTRLEIAWTIAPALILAFVAVPTVTTIFDLARRPSGDVLHVQVVGHQWWWEFRYTDPAYDTGQGPLTTANQLHVPVGRTVELTLTADPQDVLGAGNAVIHSFWAGRLFGKQDVVPGLANRLLAPVARRVTVTFRESLPRFPADRTVVTGNPVRPEVLHGDPSRAFARFGFETDVPLVVVTGGGTGAAALNEVVALATPRLVRSCSVLHLTGRGKSVTAPSLDRYRQVEFLVEEMPDVLAAAEVVVSRAGLGTLTELAVLGKPMVLVPMPRSHQEANAAAFDRADAAVVLRQDQLTPDRLAETVERLLEDRDRRAALAANARRLMPDNAADLVADAVEEAAMAATFRPEEGRRRAGR